MEDNFHKLKDKGTLAPLIDKLHSVYMKCTYRHGEHTSRASTSYGPAHQLMQDHIFYNHECLSVTKLLEIPKECCLSPAGAVKHPLTEGNLLSQLPNIVYPSDHLRLEAELQFMHKNK